MSTIRLVLGMRSQLRNWYWAGTIGWLVMQSPLRVALAHSKIARTILLLRLRMGETIRCRINEFRAFAEIFVLGDYDIPGLDWNTVRSIVDVGANIGLATIWFARRAPTAKVLAVEPSPAALALLTANLASSGVGHRATVLRIALGAATGVGYVLETDSSVETRIRPSREIGHEQPVAVETLSTLLDQEHLPVIDVLKLDCEGAEYEILQSTNPDDLRRARSIVGEFHRVDGHEPQELKSRLEHCGFRVELWPHPRDATLGRFLARHDTE
jgi:FkbM family methyltransferase